MLAKATNLGVGHGQVGNSVQCNFLKFNSKLSEIKRCIGIVSATSFDHIRQDGSLSLFEGSWSDDHRFNFTIFWSNDMGKFEFGENDTLGFKKAFDHCKTWATEHQAEVGFAEMALGASIIAHGLCTGQINFGQDMVATNLPVGVIAGGGIGAGVGGIGAALLGSIGVAGAFTFGIPAAVLTGGGMLIFGLAGYGAGDLAHRLLFPESGISDLIAGGSLLLIGTALMVDGAHRVVTDARVLRMASCFKNGIIEMVGLLTEVVARKAGELNDWARDFSRHGGFVGITPSLTASAAIAGGAAIGNAAAIGTFTVLGSHGLGSAALALGLVSAPLWPVIVGGSAGLALGVAAWKGIQHMSKES